MRLKNAGSFYILLFSEAIVKMENYNLTNTVAMLDIEMIIFVVAWIFVNFTSRYTIDITHVGDIIVTLFNLKQPSNTLYTTQKSFCH